MIYIVSILGFVFICFPIAAGVIHLRRHDRADRSPKQLPIHFGRVELPFNIEALCPDCSRVRVNGRWIFSNPTSNKIQFIKTICINGCAIPVRRCEPCQIIADYLARNAAPSRITNLPTRQPRWSQSTLP